MTLLLSPLPRARAGAASRILSALIVALGLGAAGFQDKASASTQTHASAPAAAASAAPERTAPPTSPAASSPKKTAAVVPARPVPASQVVVIKRLTPGDRACYVELENARGQRSNELASFEVCEQKKLLGQRVRLQREPTAIMALSCQGNPECTKTQTVKLIVAAEKAR